MTIRLEALNLIVPIAVIQHRYPGGWSRCREDHGLDPEPSSFAACWHDGLLFRDGAMNPLDFALLMARWESMGLRRSRRRKGVRVAGDFCVYASFSDSPEYPCEWLDIDVAGSEATFVGPARTATTRT